MAMSYNRIAVIGNVGNDPEVRTTNGGRKVASFSVATNRRWKNAAGESQEKTEWHRCVAWNGDKGQQLADLVEKYVQRGKRVFLTGPMEYREWEDKAGAKRTAAEINVKELIVLDRDPAPAGQEHQNRQAAAKAGRPAKAAAAAKNDFADFNPRGLDEQADEDDDLPF